MEPGSGATPDAAQPPTQEPVAHAAVLYPASPTGTRAGAGAPEGSDAGVPGLTALRCRAQSESAGCT